MKKISRRSFLTATGILTASAALTACSGGGSTGKAGAFFRTRIQRGRFRGCGPQQV